jgi:MoxR-like ATPase
MKAKTLEGLIGKRGKTCTVCSVRYVGQSEMVTNKGKLKSALFKVSVAYKGVFGKEKVYEVNIFRANGSYYAICSCGKEKCTHLNSVLEKIAKSDRLKEEIEFILTGPKAKVTEEKNEVDFEHPLIAFAWKKTKPLLLAGETGTGKTYAILKLIKELREKGFIDEFIQINLSGGVEDIDLIGKIIPANGTWKVIDGELTKAFRLAQKGKKVVVLLEELTRASQSARNLILKAIDPTGGEYVLNNFLTGETLRVGIDRIWFVGTANIGYEDTEALDPALKRRFIIVYKGYDEEKEKLILLNLGYDPMVVERIIQFAKAVRNVYKNGDLESPLDTGTLKEFGELLKMDKNVALEYLTYKLPRWENSKPSEEEKQLLEKIFHAFFN